jgi:hypothetical protein
MPLVDALPRFASGCSIQSVQNLRYSRPTDAEVTGESGTTLELAGVEQRLVIPGELQRIAGFFRSGRNARFGFAGTVPGVDSDDGGSM